MLSSKLSKRTFAGAKDITHGVQARAAILESSANGAAGCTAYHSLWYFGFFYARFGRKIIPENAKRF